VNLGYRPPYDVPAMLRFLALRAIPGVEHVDGLRVRRSLRADALAPAHGWLEAEFVPETAAQAPRVRLRFAPSLAPHSARVVAGVRRWLDLDASPDTIDAALADLPGAPGLRLPGCVDGFEVVVRAVLGQQVTVAAARTLARRFADRFGEPIATPWPEITRSFPAPEAVAAAPVEQIAELGIIRTRAGAIQALARAWPEAVRHLHHQREPEALIAMLRTLPGIGPWTAHYIGMRALSWPDAFPPNDVAVLNALKPRFGTTTPREAETLAERWRPWRAYAVLRLWNSLA
ncbi:MAG TPA: AlkA N-terminal domain-containing protein, partial [Rhizobacter sp.]